jgi:hypothetical protein
MALLELVAPRPDWTTALGKALERPPGVPERRQRPAEPETGGAGDAKPARHRRLADDLAWLREVVDEPAEHGFDEVRDTAAVAVWRTELDGDHGSRLCRLRDRGVLDAAGFLLHESDE